MVSKSYPCLACNNIHLFLFVQFPVPSTRDNVIPAAELIYICYSEKTYLAAPCAKFNYATTTKAIIWQHQLLHFQLTSSVQSTSEYCSSHALNQLFHGREHHPMSLPLADLTNGEINNLIMGWIICPYLRHEMTDDLITSSLIVLIVDPKTVL